MGQKKINILIIGAGKGGKALLQLLSKSQTVNIVGVVDVDSNAPGIKLAKELGIATGSDYKKFLRARELDEIINVTGNQDVQQALIKLRPQGVGVIEGHSAKLIWELVEEQQEMMRAHGESENRLKTVMDSVLTGIVLIDAESHKIIDANPLAVELIGLPKEQIIGKVCHKFICPAEINKCPITDLHQTVDKSERILLTHDGRELPILKTVALVEFGGRNYIVDSFIDISERKQIEEKIKQSAELWDRTFDAISDLIFILDKDNTVIRANKIFIETLGLKPDEVIGKKCYEILHKSDQPWPECPHGKTIKDKKSHSEEVDDPNIGIPLLVTTSPIIDEKGQLSGSVHIAKDISQMKEAEKDLRKKMHDLEVFQKAAVGRELKMVELKRRIKQLEEELKQR